MSFPTFEELQAQIQSHYHSGEYEQAFLLASREFENFPEQAHLLAYWRIALAASMGRSDLALKILKQVLDTGFWYSDVLLDKSPALQPLQGVEGFGELLRLNRRLQEEDLARLYPILTLRSQGRCGTGTPACPLLLALHAGGSMAPLAVDFWRPAATAGWLLAIPQSTQPVWKGAYTWEDRSFARTELKKHFSLLLEQYSIDLERVALAGQDLGAETALWLALTNSLPASSFILIGPSGPLTEAPERWEAVVRENLAGDLRGYILLGEEDETVPQENVETLADLLNTNGIPCELEVVPHAGHDYAPEFEAPLLRALEYIKTT